MSRNRLTTLLAILVAASALLAPPATASSTSAGASCLADAAGADVTCMIGTVETTGWDCGYYYGHNLDWGCTPQYTLTFTVPAGQCAVAKLGLDYVWDVCLTGADQTFTMEAVSSWIYAWEMGTVSVDLCLGTTDLGAPQCARWLHTSEPAPYDPAEPAPEEDSTYLLGTWAPEMLRALREESRPPAGAAIA